MQIKHFTASLQPIHDPRRPSRVFHRMRLVASGNTELASDGVRYFADSTGWINVPQDVGMELCSFRQVDGSGLYAFDGTTPGPGPTGDAPPPSGVRRHGAPVGVLPPRRRPVPAAEN